MPRDENCIFCQIIDRKIPSKVVIEDDSHIVISDVHPQAPIHILVIPKNHVRNITELSDKESLGSLLLKVTEAASHENIDRGFRIVVNTGDDGGQTVDHLHVHVLGGRQMHWPPG